MKTIYLVFAMLFIYSANAQTDPKKDVLDETKTITTKEYTGDGIKESKVEINTRTEQSVKLAEGDENEVNQNRVYSPVEVTETVKVTENSPFTANKNSMIYEVDGKTCEFKMQENGFLILDSTNSEPTKVEQSDADSTQFVMNDNGQTGIGYFDENGNFIVQQFDRKSNKIISKTYTLVK
ncbi:hypothetical protein [Formosa sp. PL04]|uniref:hypothetical protein n=1 Tax=Formosa sp. PL04 TaxID=3081755 RepID=UPI0029821507|nr:hypothetical protein [Formosa sp. PL04]MDW5288432.1 hypothetical protein [Formosa sp. PL04]